MSNQDLSTKAGQLHIIGEVYPPSNPSYLRASYYHWGIEPNGNLKSMLQGWCNSTGRG
jgi:hypothetical protein